jgi:intraflagellar transport protein 140
VPELDARVGLVALQLGLPEDAACLFAGCERWDLLGQLHAASGRWDDAVKVAAAQDRCVCAADHDVCAHPACVF